MRKAFRIRELFPIVEHPDSELDFGGQACRGLSDVPTADQQERDPGCRRHKRDPRMHLRTRPQATGRELRRNGVPVRRERARRNRRSRGIEQVTFTHGVLGSGRDRDRFRETVAAVRKFEQGTVVRAGGRAGMQRVSNDGHASAADEAIVPPIIVIQLERESGGKAQLGQVVQHAAFDLGFDTAAAEGAGLGPVGEDEHGSTGFLRRRPARRHDRAVDARQAEVQRRIQLCEEHRA